MKVETYKRLLSSIILIPIAFFFIIKGSFFFIFFLLLTYFITIFEWYKMTRDKPYYLIGLIFLSLSFYSVLLLRNNVSNEGFFLFLFITLICISTDIGGYIFGKIFKGPKLTKISPKKTFSGMLGGIILSIIIINILFSVAIPSLNMKNEFTIFTFFFILAISLISQIGDIIVSYFKRLSKIKDTGRIIPGHGGILDRIDGMIFAFPFSYLISLLIDII